MKVGTGLLMTYISRSSDFTFFCLDQFLSICWSYRVMFGTYEVYVFRSVSQYLLAGLSGLVGCAVRLDQEVAGSNPTKVGNILSWRFDHEIFSTVIHSLLLIQEGQLSVSGKRMCTILVNRLED